MKNEFRITGPAPAVDAIFRLLGGVLSRQQVFAAPADTIDMNVRLEDEAVDDLVEACDQAGVKCKRV